MVLGSLDTKKGSIPLEMSLFSWTSQGLNLGPPDYESVSKHDKSYGFIMCNQLSYKYFTSVCKPINKLS